MIRHEQPIQYRFMSLRTLICVVLLSMSVSAHGKDIVRLSGGDITISEALKEITAQTGYNFGYNSSLLNISKKVTIPETEAPLDQILNQLLTGTGYTYVIRDNYIIISPKSEKGQKIQVTNHEKEHLPSQLAGGELSKTLVFNFRFDKSLLEREYLNNAQRIDELNEILSDQNTVSRIIRIEITGTSSPDGATLRNERIAKERAAAVKGYILWKYPHLDRQKIFTYNSGEDWEGLLKMVEEDPNIPSKMEVINVLRLPESNDYKKQQLAKLSNGKPSGYIAKNILRYLRTGASCIFIEIPETEVPSDEPDNQPDLSVEIPNICDDPEPEIIVPEPFVKTEISIVEPESLTVKKGGLRWALKTNALYDLMFAPNAMAEFDLGNRWSVAAGGTWSWWKFGNKFFHRVQIGEVEGRKWFGSSSYTPFTGFYAGVYAMAGTYDIMLGGNMGSLSDFSYSTGITMGYSMPLGRRLNLEMGIGVGYFGGRYKKYTYSADDGGCYPWQGTFERRYIGPTKANVSLVWLMGGAQNKKVNKR